MNVERVEERRKRLASLGLAEKLRLCSFPTCWILARCAEASGVPLPADVTCILTEEEQRLQDVQSNQSSLGS